MSSAVAQAALRLPTRAAVSLRLSTHSPRPAAPPRRRLLPPTHRERSLAVAAHAASGAAPAVLAPNPPAARPSCPPEEYDHNAALRARSVAFCRASFPELADLVEAGVLIVIERPADYVERREDGYQEPEVVFLVGTSHVSLTSAEHVARVVHAVRPNNTVVELCRSRASIMYIDESSAAAGSAGGLGRPGGGGAGSTPAAGNEFALGGTSGFAQSLQRSLRLGGAPALLIRAALAAVSARLGAKVGASPGGEFRAARSAALACGSQIVLGDRPLEITLSRAWASASTKDRAEFAAFLFRGLFGSIPKLTQSDIDRVRGDDGAVRQLFLALSERYPALAAPLLYERDTYLAWSLKRSKAVNGAKRVVGVLGKGHLRGVCYALTHEQEALRFDSLVGRERGEFFAAKKKKGLAGVDWPRLAVETVLGVVAWEVFCSLTGREGLLLRPELLPMAGL